MEDTEKTERALQSAKKVRAVRWDGKWVAIVDLADGRKGWGQHETLMRAIESAIEDASFEPAPAFIGGRVEHYDMRSAYPKSLTAAVVAHDIAHGAAPALATNQTLRELMAAESKRIDENELDDFNGSLGRVSVADLRDHTHPPCVDENFELSPDGRKHGGGES